MLRDSLESYTDVNHALLDECTTQVDVKLYIQLHGYGNFQFFDLPGEMELPAISKIVSQTPHPSRIKLKRPLFKATIPMKLPKSIRENAVSDKKYALGKGYLLEKLKYIFQ